MRVAKVSAMMEAGVSLALNSSLLAVLAVGGQQVLGSTRQARVRSHARYPAPPTPHPCPPQVLDGTLSYGAMSSFLLYTVFLGFHAGQLSTTCAAPGPSPQAQRPRPTPPQAHTPKSTLPQARPRPASGPPQARPRRAPRAAIPRPRQRPHHASQVRGAAARGGRLGAAPRAAAPRARAAALGRTHAAAQQLARRGGALARHLRLPGQPAGRRAARGVAQHR